MADKQAMDKVNGSLEAAFSGHTSASSLSCAILQNINDERICEWIPWGCQL